MSLQSHRKFLIDEISRMSNIQVPREFLRKFTIPTLLRMLEEIRDKDGSYTSFFKEDLYKRYKYNMQ